MNPQKGKLSLAPIGIIAGVLALILAVLPGLGIFAFVLAGVALVFGVISLLRVNSRSQSIAAIVLAVVAVVAVFVSQSIYENDVTDEQAREAISRADGERTDELLENDVDIELGSFTVADSGDFGTDTTLPVLVTNKHAERKSYEVQIEAVSADGTQIATDGIAAIDLAPNQTDEFEAFKFVTAAEAQAMRTAEFRILSVSQL